MSVQVFEVSDIPTSLWDSAHEHGHPKLPKGKLRLPVRLEESYRQAIDDLGLASMASNIDDRKAGIIGDQGEVGAREHFAKCFSGSLGRVQLFALDPHQTFKTTRQALATLFSAGTVRLLDIPLGAGAGAIAIISAVAQLRAEEQAVFPRLDLDVQVVGGDSNEHQIALAERLFALLRPWWLEQGINATLEATEWDVLSDESTSDLLDLWDGGLQGAVVPALVGANFSGFLGASIETGSQRRWFDEAESSLRQAFAVASKRRATTFWIEPAIKEATEHLLPRLRSRVFDRYSKIRPTAENQPASHAYLADPIVVGGGFAVRATGIHLTPTR